MRRMQRIVLLATLVAIAPVIAGCADFDPEKLDIFGLGDKKKLPGDRKPVFPEGVPGVSQGIPPGYVMGDQPPADTSQAVPVEPVNSAPAEETQKKTAAVAPAEEPKAKPKPKRTVKRKPKPSAATAAAPEPAAQQPLPAWPAPDQQPASQQAPSSWPAQGQSSSTAPNTEPWPSAPPSGTFSR